MKQKIVYIISEVQKSNYLENIIIGLSKAGVTIEIILLNKTADTYLQHFLSKHHFKVFHLIFTGKKDYPILFLNYFSY